MTDEELQKGKGMRSSVVFIDEWANEAAKDLPLDVYFEPRFTKDENGNIHLISVDLVRKTK